MIVPATSYNLSARWRQDRRQQRLAMMPQAVPAGSSPRPPCAMDGSKATAPASSAWPLIASTLAPPDGRHRPAPDQAMGSRKRRSQAAGRACSRRQDESPPRIETISIRAGRSGDACRQSSESPPQIETWCQFRCPGLPRSLIGLGVRVDRNWRHDARMSHATRIQPTWSSAPLRQEAMGGAAAAPPG